MSDKSIWEKIENFQKNQVILVDHRGYKWEAWFEWQSKLADENYLSLNKYFEYPIPMDYQKFLVDYSNGAKLYYDHVYGQWGYWLYSDRELIDKQDYWRKIYGSVLLKYLVFGECFGDSDLLLFDTTREDKLKNSYQVAICNPIDTADDWPRAGESFSEWLGLLIEAQGTKFWECYY